MSGNLPLPYLFSITYVSLTYPLPSFMLSNAGLRVDIDDSDKSPGYKFSEAEVRGIPVRIEVGPKDIDAGVCVAVKRNDNQKVTIKLDKNLPEIINGLLNIMHNEMYEKAQEYLDEHTTRVTTYDEFKDKLESVGGFIEAPWCGKTDCELKIKEDTTATSRCITDKEPEKGEKCIYCGEEARHVVKFAKSY